jgi:hypothetical protein
MISLINWAEANFWMIVTIIGIIGIPIFIGVWLYLVMRKPKEKKEQD